MCVSLTAGPDFHCFCLALAPTPKRTCHSRLLSLCPMLLLSHPELVVPLLSQSRVPEKYWLCHFPRKCLYLPTLGMITELHPAQGTAPGSVLPHHPPTPCPLSGDSGLGLVRRTFWNGRLQDPSCTGACAASCWRIRSSRRSCRSAAS